MVSAWVTSYDLRALEILDDKTIFDEETKQTAKTYLRDNRDKIDENTKKLQSLGACITERGGIPYCGWTDYIPGFGVAMKKTEPKNKIRRSKRNSRKMGR